MAHHTIHVLHNDIMYSLQLLLNNAFELVLFHTILSVTTNTDTGNILEPLSDHAHSEVRILAIYLVI